MHLGRWLGWGAALGVGALAVQAVRNVYEFKVTELRVNVDTLKKPLHVVQLSDLHYGLMMQAGSVSNWVRATLALEPDLIVITGDFVQGRPYVYAEPLTQLLAPLDAPLGVWGIWGNHDHVWYTDEPHTLKDIVEDAGITILDNEGTLVRDDLYLAGVDDFDKDDEDISKSLADKPDGVATLLLCHRPKALKRVPPWVDLCLSGHTHGGQVRVGPVKDVPVGWQPGSPRAYVSAGLGVGFTPFRWNCVPELVSVRLVPSR